MTGAGTHVSVPLHATKRGTLGILRSVEMTANELRRLT